MKRGSVRAVFPAGGMFDEHIFWGRRLACPRTLGVWFSAFARESVVIWKVMQSVPFCRQRYGVRTVRLCCKGVFAVDENSIHDLEKERTKKKKDEASILRMSLRALYPCPSPNQPSSRIGHTHHLYLPWIYFCGLPRTRYLHNCPPFGCHFAPAA